MAETKDAEKRVLLELEYLQECLNAVLLRRVKRGRQNIRTRQGYELLRSKYQPRLRFLHEAGTENVDSSAEAGGSENSGEPSEGDLQAKTHQQQDNYSSPSRFTEVKPNEDDDDDDTSRLEEDDDDERAVLERVVGVYFDPRIKRFITDVCWPLAHFGGHYEDHNVADGALRRHIPEWKELEQDKYFAFTFKMMLWLFPGLPGFEAQDQAERDWQKDCEFDAYGSYGLSYEGFAISLIDLATACTSGSVEACLEFLEIMAKRLQVTLPLYRDPTQQNLLLAGEEGDSRPGEFQEEIQWRQIPLERLTPCQLRPKAQYYELKAKLSVHPLVLMVLLGDEKPAELQLSTSAELLIRERDSCASIRRKTIALKSHFVELEKQFLWTFRDLGDRLSLLLIPNHCVSQRTLSLYACLRLIDGREQELQRQQTSTTFGEDEDTEPSQATSSAPSPILTLFSNIQEPFPLMYGTEKSFCGRIDRQSTRLFIIDHRERSNASAITLKTSLIQNTTSGGGAGAAAVVAAMTLPPSSTASAATPLDTSNNTDAVAAHSFIFVAKAQDEFVSKPNVRVQKMQATLPQQWYTTLSGSNESKSILIDAPEDSSLDGIDPSRIFESNAENSPDSQSPKSSAAGLYYLYIFSLHGFYFEALYEDKASAELSNSDRDLSSGGDSKRDGAGDAQNNAAESPEATDAANDSTTTANLLGTAGSILNSATLLRRLLLLRKKRQKKITAQLPPDLLEGSKVTNVKSLSAAETLKSKFLRARAMERQVRLLKNAESFQTKVIAKLMRFKKKRELFAGGASSRGVLPEASSGSVALIDGGIPNYPAEHFGNDEIAKIDAKVALLSEFFKEMAVFQPTQQEMREKQSQQALDDKKEDALLERFSDVFEHDTALQNLVDEEKWLSTDEKAAKRKALMQERTLKSNGKATSLKVVRSNATGESTLTSDDYYSTAQYIEELMREVANDEAKGSSDTEIAVHSTTQEDANTAQLAISWTYAQHRTQPRATSTRATSIKPRYEKRDLDEFVDDNRRDEWMKSPYIQQLVTSEHAAGVAAGGGSRHLTNPLRPPFIPKMQSFHDQELSMPWQAVWEAPAAQRDAVEEQFEPAGSVGVGVAYEAGANREQQQSPRKQALHKSPHRPPERRPKTAAAAATGASTWSGASPRREQVNTASQSATFSYHNSRRIRSAQVRVQKAEPKDADALAGGGLMTPSRDHALDIDFDFTTHHSTNAGTGFKSGRAGFKETPSPIVREMTRTTTSQQHRQEDSAIASFVRHTTQSGSIATENHHQTLVSTSTLLDSPPEDLEPPPVMASITKERQDERAAVQQANPLRVKSALEMKKKKKAIKRRTDGEKRFVRQVRELLAISTELKQNAEFERASASKVDSGYLLASFPPH